MLHNAIVEALGLDRALIPVRGARDQDEPADMRSMAGARILLAEDNEINQEVASNLLEALGMRVTLAKDGAEAVELCHRQSFDLIFMDIQMPVMDGLTATRRIRALPGVGPASPPIIAMTAHAMSGDREKSLEAGMNDHITKPIDPQVLSLKLRLWLGCGRAQGGARHFPLPGPAKVLYRATGPRYRKPELGEPRGTRFARARSGRLRVGNQTQTL